jgi:2-polyprenyl-3-methyl-5-hydroxy-6-metoxy-1,4-benzoquinol methylase
MHPCLCGHSESRHVFPIVKLDESKNIRIVQCLNCNQYRTFPSPMSEQGEADKLYDAPEYFLGAEINPASWMKMQEGLLQNILDFKKGGSLLDIGCGMGFLPESARRMGFKARGIDLNSHAVAKGQKMFPELDISCSGLDTIANNSIDIIVLNHVIEHVIDPISFLKEVSEKLRPDGILIIGVPNLMGGIPRFLRMLNHVSGIPGSSWTWFGYQLEQHVWHFTPKLMRKMLEKNNWKILRLRSDLNMYYGATELPQLRYRVLKFIWNFFEKLKMGDNLLVIVGRSKK